MDPLVYPRERTLGVITLLLGILVWLLIVVGTFGFVLVYLLAGFVAYLFTQSALIAWLKGTGIRLSPTQFPDLHERLVSCCRTLGIANVPEAYLVSGGGVLNAFATRFLGRNFVVLLSDVVDALESRPDGINFYIGHELGHIRMKHLTGHLWRAPVLWLPLLGSAYSRAREYTCDRHGRACCPDTESATRALVALSAGAQRWQSADIDGFVRQAHEARGFWSSFHELTAAYPWLTKRVGRVRSNDFVPPRRSFFAYVVALFVPYLGPIGGGVAAVFGMLMLVTLVSALIIPVTQTAMQRGHVSQLWDQAAPVREKLAAHYLDTGEIPDSLAELYLPDTLGDGNKLELDSNSMILTATFKNGDVLRMTPSEANDGKTITWTCRGVHGITASVLPPQCRD